MTERGAAQQAPEHRGRKRIPMPELLAPAGSPEALRAAIAAGADAVYLSGRQFGARKYAANFSEEEIGEAVRYAHLRGVRVSVTVNTLIHDRELAGVGDYLLRLYGMGVDAVLVQDEGVAALAREIAPGLVLHASTQMTIHNAAGVRRAAGLGFARVVLARELSLAEIDRIRAETAGSGIGLEIFAHGALCYSYSGQCLLSSAIGGRSGNRGMCAQPCRKPYALVFGDADEYGRPDRLREVPLPDRYLLSPKDLCTYADLKDLVGRADSLKIEGRMKSPQYVAIVVAAYRRALDAIASGTWNGPDPATVRDLKLAFSRGFTRGYLFGDRHDALMGRDAPDNRGLLIGTVARYDRKAKAAAVRLAEDYIPATGDGLLFQPAGGREELGFSLNTVPARLRDGIGIPVPREIPQGTRVFVTFSRGLENRANRIIADPPDDLRRPVPLDLSLVVGKDGSMTFSGSINPPGRDPVSLSFVPGLVLEPARSRPLSSEQIAEQIAKTGDSAFTVRNLAIAYENDRFAPVGQINQVRRDLLAYAADALLAASRPSPEAVSAARGVWERIRVQYRVPERAPAQDRWAGVPLRLAVYTDSMDGVQAAAGAGADSVCFGPDIAGPRHACPFPPGTLPWEELVQEASRICRAHGTRLVLMLPRIAKDPYLGIILPRFQGPAGSVLDGCMAENAGTAAAVRETVPDLPLLGGPGLNIFNGAAARFAGSLFSQVTLSPELSGDEIRILAAMVGPGPDLALVVQGPAGAMVTEDCLAWLLDRTCPAKRDTKDFLGLRDETGRVFPVRTDGSCRTLVGNAAELCLVDHLPEIFRAGIREIAIDARGKPARYTREMTAIYKRAVGIVAGTADGTGDFPAAIREEAKAISCGGITAGHFLRGLKE